MMVPTLCFVFGVLCAGILVGAEEVYTNNDGSSRHALNECIYEEISSTPCEPNVASVLAQLALKHGNPSCDQTKSVFKPCGQYLPGGSVLPAAEECHYHSVGGWSACDEKTGKKTKVKILKFPSTSCPPSRSVTRRCDEAERWRKCKYDRSDSWTECDGLTRYKTKVLTLQEGPEHCANKKTLSKLCRKRCKYHRKARWSECDSETLTQTRVRTLRKGGDHCEPTEVDTKKCKIVCRYHRDSHWSRCDETTLTKQKVLTLKQGGSKCEPTKTLSEPCQVPKKCKYGRPEWSECDPTTGEKTKVRILRRGHSKCPEKKTKIKRCRPWELYDGDFDHYGDLWAEEDYFDTGRGRHGRRRHRRRYHG